MMPSSDSTAGTMVIRTRKASTATPKARVKPSDLMIVSGRVANKMVPVIKQLFYQMPDPKWVISMGACASIGGVFDNYALVQGVDQVVPVDVYVPGCPPRPESLIYGIVQLQRKIALQKLS